MTGLSSYPQTVPIVPDLTIQAYFLIQGLDLVDAFSSDTGTKLRSCFVFACFGTIQRFKDSFLNFFINNK